MNKLAQEMYHQKSELTFVTTYSDGVGKMFNQLKEQMEHMKSAIQELKDA